MAQRPGIRIKYRPVRPATAKQLSWVGTQGDAGRRGWWPDFGASPDAGCTNLSGAVAWAGRIAAVGSFANVGASARAGFAMWDRFTGALDDAFTITFTGGPPTTLETDGTWLYLGGSFTALTITPNGGSPVATGSLSGLCRISYAGEVDTTWLPALNASANLAVLRYNPVNASLYIAGDALTTVNGTARARLAELPIVSASPVVPTAWDPEPDAAIRAIAIDEANQKVYLAGQHTTLYAVAHTYLNRLTMTGAGAVDSWAPAPNAQVISIAYDTASGYLFAVGSFTQIGAAAVVRNRAAGLDSNANAIAWNPNLNLDGLAVAVYRNIVLIGGSFTTVGGVARLGLAAVGVDNALRVWDPSTNGDVDQILLVDRTAYCFGAFTTIGTGSTSFAAAVPYPIFTNSNTKYVAKTGSDGAAGTLGAPYLTVGFALAQLAGAFTYVVVLDSGTYGELITVTYSANEEGGLFAADGQTPILTQSRGAVPGTYGARASGRTKFSAGAGATFIYVSKQGNDGTGARGNSSLPYLTITGALGDAARVANDTVQIQDSGRYAEAGAIAVGANAVTIQAAAGQTPIVTNTAASAIHVTMNAGVSVKLYGIIFEENATGSLPSQDLIHPTGNLELYDCTVLGAATAVSSSGNTKTLAIVNCAFLNSQNSALIIGGTTETFTVTNSYFANCTLTGGNGVINVGGAGVGTFTMTSFTIEDVAKGVAAIYLGTAGGVTTAITISGGIIRSTATKPTASVGISNQMAGGGSCAISNLLISSLGSCGILDNGAAGACARTYSTIVIEECGKTSNTAAGLNNFTLQVANTATVTLTSVLSIGSQGEGFAVAGVTAGAVKFDRCVAINARLNGYHLLQNNAGTPQIIKMYSCLEYGSGMKVALENTGTVGVIGVSGCVFQNPQQGLAGGIYSVYNEPHNVPAGTSTFVVTPPFAGTYVGPNGNLYIAFPGSNNFFPTTAWSVNAGTATYTLTVGGSAMQVLASYFWTPSTTAMVTITGGVDTVITDPLFLSTVPKQVNAGLSALSAAVDWNVASGAANIRTNAGIQTPLLILSTAAKGFSIDGFTFTGDLNFYDGVQIARSIATPLYVSYCDFQGLGPQGIQVASRATIERCRFTTNGIACNVSDAGCTVRQCVASQCDGAGFLIYAVNNVVEHCTAFRCEYGQVDLLGATDTISRDNVYAGNYALDYQGVRPQTDSDIAEISAGAEISGSRRDPLYRNVRVGTVDLRLQAVEDGFPYDSPAKGLAHDGLDAGAYAFAYPPLVTSWTLLDFDTTGWYNPFTLATDPEAIKLTEGDTFGLRKYSEGAGFMKRYDLEWGADAMMGTDQVEALIDLYTYGVGECQISFDGGTTFIPVRLKRSTSLGRSQLQGLYYSSDQVPEPIRKLSFWESP